MLQSLVFTIGAVLALDAGSGSPPPAPPAKEHRAPPKEALDACWKLTVDDPCSFKISEREINGRCHALTSDSSQLACRPDHRHHRGHDEPTGSGAP